MYIAFDKICSMFEG